MPSKNKLKRMKKITTYITAGLFTVLSASAFACPKGTTLVGGTGPNHKGGKCVPASGAPAATKATTTATKAKADTTKSKEKATTATKAVAEKPNQVANKAKTDVTAAKVKTETATKTKVDNTNAKADVTKAKADVKVTATKDKAVKTATTNPLKP